VEFLHAVDVVLIMEAVDMAPTMVVDTAIPITITVAMAAIMVDTDAV